MGRPIYVHPEEDSSSLKHPPECRTWRSFARRIEHNSHPLRDPAATLDASTVPLDALERETGVASQTSDSGDLHELMMAPPLSDSEDEWEALRQESYTPLLASGAVGTTRPLSVRRMPATETYRNPSGWLDVVEDSGPPSQQQQQQQQQQRPQSLLSERLEGYWSRAMAAEHQGGALPEWPTPLQRTRRARRAVAATEHGARASVPPMHPSWQAERASRRAPGRRASGDIPTVRETADDGRSYTALQMARHAARDLLRQLDVRIAESGARSQNLSMDQRGTHVSAHVHYAAPEVLSMPRLPTFPAPPPLEPLSDADMGEFQE